MLSELKDGDILGVRQTTFFSRLTKIAQKIAGHGDFAGITHVGVAVLIEGVWYSAEMDGRHPVLRPLKQLLSLGYDIDVYRSGVEVSQEIIHAQLEKPIKYSILGNLKTGFHLVFGFNRNGAADELEKHCADLARLILLRSGWVGYMYPQPSPSEVCRSVGNFQFRLVGHKQYA